MCDKDKDGVIGVTDLQSVISYGDESAMEKAMEAVSEVMTEYDKDGDGVLSFEEFKLWKQYFFVDECFRIDYDI